MPEVINLEENETPDVNAGNRKVWEGKIEGDVIRIVVTRKKGNAPGKVLFEKSSVDALGNPQWETMERSRAWLGKDPRLKAMYRALVELAGIAPPPAEEEPTP